MDRCTRSYFSSAPDANTSAEAFLFPKDKDHDHMRSPQTVDPSTFSGDVNYLTPTKTEPDSKPGNEKSIGEITPIDFSSLTTADLGITPKPIAKPSKGEAKSLIKKLRRQSTIGVRGSPENNSLIKYIAYQRKVKKQNVFTQPSPFKSQNTLLKDKIMAFRSSLQPLEENKKEIHLTDTFKEVSTTPHEQSKLGRACPPKCEGVALENNINHLSTDEDRTSGSIQMSSMASPSEKTLPVGMVAISEIVPVCSANIVESGYLGCTPRKEASKTKSGLKSLHSNEELSRSDSVQSSCKKVRFAKKHRWETFDKATLPVTPLQSHLLASSLRSALKKTPVKTTESMMDDYHSPVKEGGIELLSNMNCEPLQKGTSTRTIDMKQGNQNLDSDASQTHLPVDIPSCRPNRVPFSPSGSTEEKSPKITRMKQTFSQPNFDDDDNNDQGILKVALKPECATHSDLKETKSSSLDLQATCSRITRSAAKGKQISDTSKTKPKTNSKCKSSELEKDKTIAKSSCKKKPAPKQKVFGKRRKKKKEHKALHNQRETVSKIPLLSPITEVAEEISIVSSCRSSSISQKSILDDSSSSLLCAESTNGKTENIVFCFDKDNCLDLLKGQDSVTSPSSQREGDAANDIKIMLPLDPSENSRPEEPKCILPENEMVLKNDCTSYEPEVQREPEVLNLHGTDENSKSEDVSLFTVGSETDLMMNNTVTLKRFQQRSRRTSCYGSNLEVFQSEAPRKDSDAAGNNTEGLLPGINDCEFLKDLENSIEASFSGVSRMVRRSMRQRRDTENEGLVWMQVPANNVRGQSPLGSACKTKRRKSSFISQEAELFHPKQINCTPVFFPGNEEEQENAHVVIGPRKSKRRRKSICVLCPKGNENHLFDLTVAV